MAQGAVASISIHTMISNRFLVAARCAIAAALVLLVAGTVAAQTPSPDDLLQIFQGLTPEQQQAVLQRAETRDATGVRSGSDSTGSARAGSSPERSNQSDERNGRQRSQEDAVSEVPVLRAEDTVVVELSFPLESTSSAQRLEISSQRRAELEDLIALVRSRNPYVLDRNGQLILPGFAPIALLGLTEGQATQRLSVESSLLPLRARVVRLPLARTGIAGLKPYGYDTFDEAPSTFSPDTSGSVPADYVMGTGDELNVQLFGNNQNRTLRLTVNRDGSITFPGLGPIRVGGLTFNAARQLIKSRVEQQMIGVSADVLMAKPVPSA